MRGTRLARGAQAIVEGLSLLTALDCKGRASPGCNVASLRYRGRAPGMHTQRRALVLCTAAARVGRQRGGGFFSVTEVCGVPMMLRGRQDLQPPFSSCEAVAACAATSCERNTCACFLLACARAPVTYMWRHSDAWALFFSAAVAVSAQVSACVLARGPGCGLGQGEPRRGVPAWVTLLCNPQGKC